MKKHILITSLIWTLLVSLLVGRHFLDSEKEQKLLALQMAKGFFDQVVISRTWNAAHGGVYVPVTADTQPNPYLQDPLRDINVNENLKLTKINPAFMTRQLSEIARHRKGVVFHITSLKPIRPGNKPTPLEERALASFEKGITEIGQFVQLKSKDDFFYMAPLKTEPPCLKCHAAQGYKVGDIRGGISILVPWEPFQQGLSAQLRKTLFVFGAVWLIGLLGLWLGGNRINTHLKERRRAEEALRLDESRWAGLFELSQMSAESENTLTGFALEKAIELTGSKIGYLAFLNPEETVMTMYSWSRAAMQECAIENKPIEYPVEKTGLWGEAVRQRRPVITNDYQADNLMKKGYPKGHVQVYRHMNIPLFDGDRIVLVAGVGNKEEPYGNDDVTQLTMMMDGMWKILKANRAEKALRESEDQFRMFSEMSPLGMSLINIDGRYEYVNPAFVTIFGYDLEDFSTGREWFQKAYPDQDYRREVIAAWQGDLIRYPELEIRPRTFEVRCKGGDYKTILFRPITLPSDKQFIIYEDISERKRAEMEKRSLEEQLQRAEKMEALGTLAGGVAHDLNNVLGIIVGYSELLLYEIEGASPHRSGLKNILTGSQKAAAIVQDLLTLARRGVSHREVLNLNQIIHDCRNSPEFEKLTAHHSLIRIKTDLEPDLLNISGSAVHLGKTLFNLISNAGEAMPKGGLLTIKTANQYLDRPVQGYDQVREGDYVVLSISDTGEGIPSNDLKRIFEPFYTKKVMGRSGTGLGLAVVWGTVKDHQGYIHVRSQEGQGSTFTLYFPVTREDITAKEIPVSMSEYTGRGETILIVDDVQGQRDLAEAMLKKLNYTVTSVSSGEAAVAFLKEYPVDLLVLDMIMDPGLDGLDTYKKVLEIRPGQKAIIVSGFSETARVNSAQALGAGAYVKKPYVLEKLGLAVRKELDLVS